MGDLKPKRQHLGAMVPDADAARYRRAARNARVSLSELLRRALAAYVAAPREGTK